MSLKLIAKPCMDPNIEYLKKKEELDNVASTGAGEDWKVQKFKCDSCGQILSSKRNLKGVWLKIKRLRNHLSHKTQVMDLV